MFAKLKKLFKKNTDWNWTDYPQEDFENDLDMLDRAAGREIYPNHGNPTTMADMIALCEEPDDIPDEVEARALDEMMAENERIEAECNYFKPYK